MTFTSNRRSLCWLSPAACALACLLGPQTSAAAAATGTSATTMHRLQSPSPGATDATARLEHCLTALVQSERTATFVGEMLAISGTARMEIDIGLLERDTGEEQYRPVSAPGLGGWRASAPGVRDYTYIKQVTNLAAPAFYRGSVRFRWLNDRGRVIKAEEIRTPRCEQSEPPSTSSAATATNTTGATSAGEATAQTD